VAAPLRVSDNAVRLAVITRLGWIKRQRAGFQSQDRESEREMVSGESHYFMGRRMRLRVIPDSGATRVAVRSRAFIEMHVRPELTAVQREKALHRWYRRQLKQLVPPLLDKWQAKLGVQVAEWGIKKMKTRWGTCNVDARRIWLNLELAKKPPQCLEYLVVHELAHLLACHHDDRFIAMMDEHLPPWRSYRKKLNATPLAHESWSY
jgi:predicted metal-dependent hydrolase